MWRIYFGEWQTGRLKRLAYLGYDLLLFAITVVAIVGVVVLNGVESFETLNVAAIVETWGLVSITVMFVVFVAVFVAHINIMAKRFRDMGLHPWWTIAGIVLVSTLLSWLFPTQEIAFEAAIVQDATLHTAIDTDASVGGMIGQFFDLIVFLALVSIPSDFFRNTHNENMS